MDTAAPEAVAGMLARSNEIDAEIAAITGRPMTSGHLGEWIASQVFDIELERSAVAKAIDGRFRSGPLAGRTVNVKWHLKREGLLDLTTSGLLDYNLVLTGSRSAATSSRLGTRPWRIDGVYLFDAKELIADLTVRRLRVGIASSVRAQLWNSAEVFPTSRARLLPLSQEQRDALRLWAQA
jgi:hypothetical protein